MQRRTLLLSALSTALLTLGLTGTPARADAPPPPNEELRVTRTRVGEIPVLVISPQKTEGRHLVIWLTGFGGTRDSVERELRDLARHGYVAMSFDPYQHGERRIDPQDQFVARVVGNIRRYFWPILAHSAEEVTPLIDWAIREYGVSPNVGIGGVSMGGDISAAAAGVDRRIRAVSAVVGTPDWMRPGAFQPQGEPDAAAQADFDRRNPLTHLKAYRHRPAIAFQSGGKDSRVPADGPLRFVEALKPIYGKDADRLRVNIYPEVGHGFSPEMWKASLEWFERYLQ